MAQVVAAVALGAAQNPTQDRDVALGFNDLAPREALAAMAHDFHRRGWMSGTAGNLSARCHDDENNFWITASGLPKGNLDERDLILIQVESGKVMERLRPEAKPSAETSIHQVIYRLFPEARACLHVHTVDACLATTHVPRNALDMRLPALEMIKGLDIWEEDPVVELPLFDNWLDVPSIAREIERRFRNQAPQVPALMIRNHGVTVWGNSLQQAYNRVEIVEFIMSYLARRSV